jgi:hypothetical protein
LVRDIGLFSEDSGATAGNKKEKEVFSHSIVLNAPYLIEVQKKMVLRYGWCVSSIPLALRQG